MQAFENGQPVWLDCVNLHSYAAVVTGWDDEAQAYWLELVVNPGAGVEPEQLQAPEREIRPRTQRLELDRRAKARTVKSLRSQLDHCLMLQSLGQPVAEGLADRLSDQLSRLARTLPYLSLAEVS